MFRFSLSVYCPTGHGAQAFSSVTVHLGEDREWSDPFSRSSAVLFKLFDPALQQMTRECGDCEPVNEPFDFCQLALHNTCLNAGVSKNTVTMNRLEKEFVSIHQFIFVDKDVSN